MDSYQDFDFPAELCRQPQSLVAFVGLDVANDAGHRNIWEVFSMNRHSDRVPIEFTLLPPDFVLPVLKPKRASYEWYVPKGVLKTNWMMKHLQHIPSVVVLFYELDWDDPRWPEKKLECASQIHAIRAAIEGRNVKIAVVLVQKSAHFINVVTEDNLSTERASELCTTCDLNPKLLLLLHQNEHLQGYIVRLESAFYELAQSYYTQEIRNIKMHKDHLNKSSHQYLFVRHQFKTAFLNEMKQDFSTAHKHYTLANASLIDIRMTDINMNEIKVVAAFITYKLCKIYFALNQPRDAISQFNTHVDRFRLRTGPAELLFEHYMWLSKQFVVFGSLFEEATRQGLPAVQTRHPGFYYEQAAQYAVQRKQLVNSLCKEFLQYPENDPLIGWDRVEFYGQRPWRPSNRSEPLDTAREQAAVIALQYREKNIVNHSALVISYLGSAITQFKMYRSPRKRRCLAVQMADEYYSCMDYGKALTLFTHMLWEYRNDKWWVLTVDLLRKALNCAYLTASLQEYVERSIESAYLFPDEEKLRIMGNINSVIRNASPTPEPMLAETDTMTLREAWSTVMRTSPLKCINVDMHATTSFVLCKATFCEANCDAVNLEIWLRNEFPTALTFSQISVSIASTTRNTELVVVQETNEKLNMVQLNPNEIKCIPFSFVPFASDIGNEIQLKYVSLTLGSKNDDDRIINLRFSGICSESDILERKDSHLMLSSKMHSSFMRLESKLTVQVKLKVSKLQLSIEHKPPSLVGEWYKMNVIVGNKETSTAKECIMYVTLSPSFSNMPLSTPSPSEPIAGSIKNFTTEVYESIDGVACQLPCVIPLGDIPVDAVINKTWFFKTSTVDLKNVTFRVVYNTVNLAGEVMSCAKEETVKLDCVNVFEITASFLSPKCEHLSKIYVDQPVLMRMQVDCVSPWPLYVENTQFKLLDDHVDWNANLYTSYLKGRVLRNKEVGAEVISFTMKNSSDKNGVALGLFLIYWKREADEGTSSIVCTEVQLPQMKVETLPLRVDVDISSPSWVRTPLPMSLELQNNSQQLMSFDICIEHNEVDAFMFSGCKQGQLIQLFSSSVFSFRRHLSKNNWSNLLTCMERWGVLSAAPIAVMCGCPPEVWNVYNIVLQGDE